MSALHQEILRQQAVEDPPLTGAYAGRIAETATSVDDLVPVRINQFDDTLQFGPCYWMPRVQPTTVNVAETGETTHDVTVAQVVLPQRGDPCLVVFDDTETPWIVSWRPAT